MLYIVSASLSCMIMQDYYTQDIRCETKIVPINHTAVEVATLQRDSNNRIRCKCSAIHPNVITLETLIVYRKFCTLAITQCHFHEESLFKNVTQ